jgi:hypothetical protein
MARKIGTIDNTAVSRSPAGGSVFYCSGAPESAARLLRMDPGSPAYFRWVEKTLVSVLLPMPARLFER